MDVGCYEVRWKLIVILVHEEFHASYVRFRSNHIREHPDPSSPAELLSGSERETIY
jgi:hypothetical protein